MNNPEDLSERILADIYLTSDMDQKVKELAITAGKTKSDLFCEWIDTGLSETFASKTFPADLRDKLNSQPAEEDREDQIMRQIYLGPRDDGRLRQLAHELHVTKSSLRNYFVEKGLATANLQSA